MNFLSHFYFERTNPDHDMVMGVVLPDLVKNAHKDWNLNPDRQDCLFADNPIHRSILKGWNKHIEVDRLFHCSDFFKEQTAILKQMILPALSVGPVKPFFLAHIALELILDHLLITTGKVNVNSYYAQLSKSNTEELQAFLVLAGIADIEFFNKFLTNYISSKYLLSYQKTENITYALNRICMRLWPDPFTDVQLELLTAGINAYIKTLDEDFLLIFNQLEANASMKAF
jgi:acyl carrier protein phosphodiesterase